MEARYAFVLLLDYKARLGCRPPHGPTRKLTCSLIFIPLRKVVPKK